MAITTGSTMNWHQNIFKNLLTTHHSAVGTTVPAVSAAVAAIRSSVDPVNAPVKLAAVARLFSGCHTEINPDMWAAAKLAKSSIDMRFTTSTASSLLPTPGYVDPITAAAKHALKVRLAAVSRAAAAERLVSHPLSDLTSEDGVQVEIKSHPLLDVEEEEEEHEVDHGVMLGSHPLDDITADWQYCLLVSHPLVDIKEEQELKSHPLVDIEEEESEEESEEEGEEESE